MASKPFALPCTAGQQRAAPKGKGARAPSAAPPPEFVGAMEPSKSARRAARRHASKARAATKAQLNIGSLDITALNRVKEEKPPRRRPRAPSSTLSTTNAPVPAAPPATIPPAADDEIETILSPTDPSFDDEPSIFDEIASDGSRSLSSWDSVAVLPPYNVVVVDTDLQLQVWEPDWQYGDACGFEDNAVWETPTKTINTAASVAINNSASDNFDASATITIVKRLPPTGAAPKAPCLPAADEDDVAEQQLPLLPINNTFTCRIMDCEHITATTEGTNTTASTFEEVDLSDDEPLLGAATGPSSAPVPPTAGKQVGPKDSIEKITHAIRSKAAKVADAAEAAWNDVVVSLKMAQMFASCCFGSRPRASSMS